MRARFVLAICLGVFATAIISCEPDYVNNPEVPENPNPENPNPENPDPDQHPIVGKWKKIGITDDEGIDIAYHDHQCATIADYTQFFANNTVKDIVYAEDCVTTEEDSGTYTVSGSTLTMQGTNPEGGIVSGQLTITELSATVLKIKVPDMGFTIIYNKY